MTFAEKLEFQRRALGMTQIEIVDRLKARGKKVGRASMSNWFKGMFIPPGDICLAIAGVLSVPVEALLDDRLSFPLPPKAGEDPDMVTLMGIVRRMGIENAIDRLIGAEHVDPADRYVVKSASQPKGGNDLKRRKLN
jgi:transcriptional regulator with XRE-family HTH domain